MDEKSVSLFSYKCSSFLGKIIPIFENILSHLLKFVLFIFVKTSELEQHLSLLVSFSNEHSDIFSVLS